MYCRKCGGKIESYANNCAFCGTPVERYETNVNYLQNQTNPNNIKPMTAKKWIGLFLLPIIPLVGSIIQLVLMFKWAFGSTKDLTLKGYARANLIIYLFAMIISVAWIALVLSGFFGDFSNVSGSLM